MKLKIWDSNRSMYRYMKVPFTLEGGGPTDEGYFWWREKYYAEGGKIYCDYETASRDCDGPMESYSFHWCFPPKRRKDYVPEWHEVSRSQRDYFAEQMGY